MGDEYYTSACGCCMMTYFVPDNYKDAIGSDIKELDWCCFASDLSAGVPADNAEDKNALWLLRGQARPDPTLPDPRKGASRTLRSLSLVACE